MGWGSYRVVQGVQIVKRLPSGCSAYSYLQTRGFCRGNVQAGYCISVIFTQSMGACTYALGIKATAADIASVSILQQTLSAIRGTMLHFIILISIQFAQFLKSFWISAFLSLVPSMKVQSILYSRYFRRELNGIGQWSLYFV